VEYGYVLSLRFYLVVVRLRQAVSKSEESHNFLGEETPEKRLEQLQDMIKKREK